jgi:hypothetical protein
MTKPGPGKFEFNESQEESEILYEHSLDGCHLNFGESDYLGWYVLINTTDFTDEEKELCAYASYICKEDSQGFFTIIPYDTTTRAFAAFNLIEKAYEKESADGEIYM